MKKTITSHKDLIVWQKSMNLVTEIYKLTKPFPKEEMYGITSQMRRAALSIPTNIAEGAARNSRKEYTQFLYISLGSSSELETLLLLANNLSYCEVIDPYIESLNGIRKMLVSLIKKMKEIK